MERRCRNGDILLHDTKAHMVDAVELIVPQLIEEGYQLVTVFGSYLTYPKPDLWATYYHR
ncbi:MAG: hypothetical protein R2881_04095 [Eubacteriales bacterium]